MTDKDEQKELLLAGDRQDNVMAAIAASTSDVLLKPSQEEDQLAEAVEIAKQIKSRTSSIHSFDDDSDNMAAYKERIETQAAKGVEMCKVSFHDVRYTVTIKSTKEEIKSGQPATKELDVLKGCTGYCLPGQTTFIMGASGAGKTSLLNLLSDRIAVKPGVRVSGKMLLNDTHPLTGATFANYSTYVMQDDVIFAYFTVKEALTFAARLKLTCSEEEQNERIEQLIIDLGLTECQDTLVGSVTKKLISGGERKRTAIGVELITDPKMILLDEPTSGLDSFTAVRIVKCLQDLAKKRNKTIISTIHQPSSQAFSYCDRLILLADGYIVYQGPAKHSGDYFEMMKGGRTRNLNPCDFFMRELSINYPKQEEDDAKIEKYLNKYKEQQESKVLSEMDTYKVPALDLKRGGRQDKSFCTQFGLVRYRTFMFVRREPQALIAKFGQAVFVGLLSVALYWQIGGEYDREGLGNIAGCNFFILVGQFMNWLFGSILTFQLERPVFLREQANNLYSPTAYWLSKNMIETPAALITPMIQLLIMYWGIGYDNFGLVYLPMTITAQCATGIGLMLSAVSPNVNTATAIAPAVTMPVILFGGFIANTETVMPWLSWIQWISPIRYANEALAHSQFDDVPHPRINTLPAKFLAYEGFTIGYWKCFAACVGFAVFWRIMSLVALKLSISKFQ